MGSIKFVAAALIHSRREAQHKRVDHRSVSAWTYLTATTGIHGDLSRAKALCLFIIPCQ